LFVTKIIRNRRTISHRVEQHLPAIMAYWYYDLLHVLMQSTTKDSTEKIQPEVTNHLADINEHFREYLVRDISLQLGYISLTKCFGNFTEWIFAEYSNLCLQDFEYTL